MTGKTLEMLIASPDKSEPIRAKVISEVASESEGLEKGEQLVVISVSHVWNPCELF
ncbi:MAG: hypothetical protein WA323_06080 [Candidatus Nitrosopolaris sp.]